MFLREIAIAALQEAGLIRDENAPEYLFKKAVQNVIGALSYYSDCDTITCFSEHRKVTLGEETTIGKPALKRGIRLHYVADDDSLPSLDGFDPDAGDIVIGRDYYSTDDGNIYGIHKVGNDYRYYIALVEEIATTPVDILIKDIGRIVAVYKDNTRLKETSLSNFYGYACGVFVSNVDGEGRLRVYVTEAGEYDIVYSRSMTFNENTQIDIPATQKDMVVYHVAAKMARTTEKRNALADALGKATMDAAHTAADDVIPVRSEW